MASILLLSFTLAGEARADRAHASRWGTSLRAGTTVGFVEHGGDSVSALGLQVALGHKIGPLSIEAEYDRMSLLEHRDGVNLDRGRLSRLGVNGRLYFARIGRRFEPESLLLLFLEAGVGRQVGRLAGGADIDRNDVSIGGGWILDHRVVLRSSRTRLNYVGWHFGWRATASRRPELTPAAVAFAPCPAGGGAAGGGCAAPEPTPRPDLGLLVSSSLTFSW